MQLIKETNISNVIILTSIIIISALTIFTGYFFITKQYETMEREISETRERLIDLRREKIQREVDAVIDFIEFRNQDQNNTLQALVLTQDDVMDWIPTIRFGKEKNNYIFVYQVYDIRGGEFFAKMLINPNRPDLIGEFISDEYTDEEGKPFRKIALEKISKNGHAFVTYKYKKPNSTELKPKITYFKHYEKWNWIIAAGAYLDDIDILLAQKRAALKRDVQLDISSTILIFLLFSLIANSFAILLGKQIEQFFNNYRTEVRQKTEQLEVLNRTLEHRVNEEIHKNREKEQLLIQKSKFIALGEMISNIAHQWRQPLSELSALLMTLKFRFKLGKLDEELIETKSREAENLIEYMSQTIDDFRNFFAPNKEKTLFSIEESVTAVKNIIGTSVKNKNIALHVNIDKDAKVYGFQNEYEQVLLNLISNAKDALLEHNTKEPKIKISLKLEKDFTSLHVKDNAGGIKVEPISRIFEPYFSTKDSMQGTGIGLYMSKLIIENNMNGNLIAYNINGGACFEVRLKKEM